MWGVGPHMHLLGTSLSLETGGRCALSIPRWDFHWQRAYWYADPLTIESGETMTLRCRYDNLTDREVTWGDGTEDEMCVAFLYVTR